MQFISKELNEMLILDCVALCTLPSLKKWLKSSYTDLSNNVFSSLKQILQYNTIIPVAMLHVGHRVAV